MTGGICVDCGRHFTTSKLSAIANSVRFQAHAVNEDQVNITMADGRMVREIFFERDRTYDDNRIVWKIRNAQHYLYVPCIRAAMSALAHQHILAM